MDLAGKPGASGAEGVEPAEGSPGCGPEQQEMLQSNKGNPAASSSAGSQDLWEGLRDRGGKSMPSEEHPASCEATQKQLEDPTGETRVSPIWGPLPGQLVCSGLSREKGHQGHRGAVSALSAGGFYSGKFASTFKGGGQYNAAWAATSCLAAPSAIGAASGGLSADTPLSSSARSRAGPDLTDTHYDPAAGASPPRGLSDTHHPAAGGEAPPTACAQLGRLPQHGGRAASEPVSPRAQSPGGQRSLSDVRDAARRAGDCTPKSNPVAADTELFGGCVGVPSEQQFAACSGDTDISGASRRQALSEAARREHEAQRAIAAATAWGAVATTGERRRGTAECMSRFLSMCGEIEEFGSDRSASASGGGSGGQAVGAADSAVTPAAGNLGSDGGGELGTKEAAEEHSATGEPDAAA